MKFKTSINKYIEESEIEDDVDNIDNINIHSTKYMTLNDTLYGILFVSAIYYFYNNIIISAF